MITQTTTAGEILDLLDHPIISMRPKLLGETDAWQEFIPVAFLMISLTRPRCLVELGIGQGNAYCAFCQAVEALQIKTSCFAIDAREEGSSGEEEKDFVFEKLKSYHDPLYGSFSTLLDSEDAPELPNFDETPVDLLHINGILTPEALDHTIKDWLPKLSPRSIVLLSNLKGVLENHASRNLWEEVKGRYPFVAFTFGNGLGILATGSDLNSPLADLFSLETKEFHALADICEALGERVCSLHLHEQLQRQMTALEIKDEQLVLQRNTIDSLLSSKFWKFTAPLRQIGDLRHKIAMLLPFFNCLLKNPRLLFRHLPKAFFHYLKDEKKIFRSMAKALVLIPTQPLMFSHYRDWLAWKHWQEQSAMQDIKAEIARFSHQPRISVLMPTYNTPAKFLRLAIDSVLKQSYPYWELCIADDASTDGRVREVLEEYRQKDRRIMVSFRPGNGHIAEATNTALNMATGAYSALLDHDDELHEHALLQVAREINAHPSCKMLYSDEDKITENGKHKEPYFKPDWNPDLFLSQNMVCHLGVYETERLRAIGGFRPGFEGAQDYDMTLRFIEGLKEEQIRHLPDILYHWRIISGSTAAGPQEKDYAAAAGQRAVNEYLQRQKIPARAETITYLGTMQRVHYQIPSPRPLVSIIIPTRDAAGILKTCVDSIISKTSYPNYEIIIVDNSSTEPQALSYFQELASNKTARTLKYSKPFNYSAINNFAVSQAKGEFICLLNNDTEVIESAWLTEMVSHAIRPQIGAVGAKLLYPDDTIQHAGIILGIGGVAGHAHKHFPRNHYGYFARAVLTQNVSAVTGACLVVRKKLYEEVGGLDGGNFSIAFNDVDFCLRLLEKGYRNVFTPFAVLYHHESKSRGYEDSPAKEARFAREMLEMKSRWRHVLSHDPAYNPNLTLTGENFDLQWPIPDEQNPRR